MKRKIVKQGQKSHTVSLPIKWVRENRLTEKDSVEVVSTRDGLFIRPLHGKGQTATYDLESNHEHSIQSSLCTFYRMGYHEITFLTKNEKQHTIIKELVDKIFADLSYEENGNSIVITREHNDNPLVAHVVGRKMVFLLRIILFEFTEALKEGTIPIEQLDAYLEQQNQLDNLCARGCVEEEENKQLNYAVMYLSGYMQAIAHSVYHLAKKLHEKGEFSLEENVIELFTQLTDSFTELSEALIAKNADRLAEADQQLREVFEQALIKIQMQTGISSIVLYYAGEISRQLHHFAKHAVSYMTLRRISEK